jgi:hypothetical protein
MKRFSVASFASLTVLVLAADLARAQNNLNGIGPYGPFMRPPAVSPYLNLLNSGNPGINYYLLVRPEIEFRARANQLEAALQNLEQRRGQPATGETEELLRTLNIADPLRGTGHPVVFGDYYPYYNMRGAANRGTTGGRPNTGGYPQR